MAFQLGYSECCSPATFHFTLMIILHCTLALVVQILLGSASNHYHHNRLLWEDEHIPIPASIHELWQHPFNSYTRKTTASDAELTPLYHAYGSHFAFIFVGTPPQRQSVIIDTGSHYTAFPCTGCSQCGQHTDAYWNLTESTTATVPKFNQQLSVVTQSYSEGSSWQGFKVIDKLWAGGVTPELVLNANNYTVDFEFGCITYETGLFRTQVADGIMGMSISKKTLPNQLVKQGITKSWIFALCFSSRGGIMTLGGVDQRVHTKPNISYAKLMKSTGFFVVNLVNILFQDQKSLKKTSLGVDKSQFNSGTGCIVDSGTTGTHLPFAVSSKFSNLFKTVSGVAYSSATIALTAAQLSKIPNLIFVLESTSNSTFEVEMPWTSFVDSIGGGKYAVRVHISKGSDTVLGANFMTGYNVIFDVDQQRLGFAKSNCQYKEFAFTAKLSAADLSFTQAIVRHHVKDAIVNIHLLRAVLFAAIATGFCVFLWHKWSNTFAP